MNPLSVGSTTPVATPGMPQGQPLPLSGDAPNFSSITGQSLYMPPIPSPASTVADQQAPAVSTSSQANQDVAGKKSTVAAVDAVTQQQAQNKAIKDASAKAQAAAMATNPPAAAPAGNNSLQQQVGNVLASQTGPVYTDSGTIDDGKGGQSNMYEGRPVLKLGAFRDGASLAIDPSGNTQATPEQQAALSQGIQPGSAGWPKAPAAQTYEQQQADYQAKLDAEYTQHASDLEKLKNGTFPLTPDQQAQVDNMRAQFDLLKQQQALANKNLEGATTIAGIAAGRNRYAPEIEAGNIFAAVSAGIQKVADIEVKASGAISQLKQGFTDNNLKLIDSAYKSFTDYMSQKEATITKMHDDTVKAANDARDYNYKVSEDKIKNDLESDKFTYQQKLDKIDQAFKDQTLSETQRHNLVDEAQKWQALKIQEQANTPGAEGTHPAVRMTASNQPNKADQAAFLASLGSVDLQTLVKGMAEYDINPNSVPTRNYKGVGGLTQSQVISLAKQYDPSFSESLYATRQALRTNFTSGKYSQNINGLNTAVGHISDIIDNFAGLSNADFTPYNAAKNAVASIFGSGAPGQAKLNVSAATSEIASVFKGAGATDEEIKTLGAIDFNSSPDQVQKYVETATQLLASRLGALQDTYTSGMGKAPDKSFLSTSSQLSLLNLQKMGLDIKVPQLADSPIIKLQTFNDADPKHASLLQQLGQADPSLAKDPQAMIDYLAQNGIEL